MDDVWKAIYSTRWVKDLETRARDCKSCFHKYKNSKITEKRSRLLCEDVVLWWRMNKAIEITAANLRQRMLQDDGIEFLRSGLNRSLDVIESSGSLLGILINGRQVQLAEEIKFVKNIITLLQRLNTTLNTQHTNI